MGYPGDVDHTVGVHWQDKSVGLCLLGGLAVGTIAATRMLIFGKVTGISGFFQNAVVFDPKYVKEHGWFDQRRIASVLFLIGLMVGGAIDRKYLSNCFQDWTVLPMERLVIAGLLVGFGTKKGNGCTSGHGVCGISSFRFRSLVATCTFMVFSIATALATDTYSYLPTFRNELDVTHGYATILVVLAVCAMLAGIAWHLATHHSEFVTTPSFLFTLYVYVQELLFGLCFALAMGVSNMTQLSAVISFLDLRYWNPALAFVMGGAICVATPSFFFIFKRDVPLFDKKFHRSSLTEADKALVMGAAVFGIGWGLYGACPGPALVNIGSGNTPPIIYAFAIAVGMYIEQASTMLLDKYPVGSKENIYSTGAAKEDRQLLESDVENSAKSQG